MTAIRIVVPGADFSALGLGKFKTPLKADPTAMYCFGSSMISGSSYVVGQDLTGNYAALTPTGSPSPGSLDTALGSTNFYTAPFPGDALAATNNAFSVVVLHKTPMANNACLVSTSADDFATRDFTFQADSSHEAFIAMYNPGRSQAFGSFSTRGSQYELVSARASLTTLQISRQYSGQAYNAPALTTFASQAIGGAHNFLIGNNFKSPPDFTGPTNIAMVAFWNRLLSDAEMQGVYSDLQAWLNPLGYGL